ncbi:MAG TPA: M28 family peptidase [Gaiellaceae bacterium]|nr:M28 family peptidase [Gaiellaceae bacterium]
MAASPSPRRRRRARRGSVERPVNGRLYRSAFLVSALPLVVLAFSIVRPAPLPAPALPADFDGGAARSLAADLATHLPDRSPGGAGSVRAAQWFREHMALYGLPVSSDTWRERVPGRGRVRLQNLWAVAAGQSRDAIVVLAHRDDDGTGPGADDDASGTAALVELARDYAAQAGGSRPVRSAHTLVFLSTDGGAFGGLGARRFARRLPFKVVAAVNLDAIAGSGPPRVEIAGDEPRSPAAALVETAAKRVLEQTGEHARRAGLLGQLIDLGFPFTLYEQGPLVAAGIPAVTLTTAGARPPAAFVDRAGSLDARRLGQLGRAAQQIVGSLDQGLGVSQGTTSFLWTGGRIVRGWALELLLVSLLAPFVAVTVDLFAHCRRRRIPLLPALRSLRRRLALWLFAGAAFLAFRLLGAWPSGAPAPPSPSSPVAGNWPVAALTGLAVVVLAAWLVTRRRLVPRRAVSAEERLAGDTAALLGLAIVALLVVATNPFALLFVLPPLHAWLWLPQVRRGRPPARAVYFLLGLAGPALVVGSLAVRYGLGLDAPWYLVLLAAIGYVHLPAILITLCGGACAAQLAAVAAGRYAPYPDRRELPGGAPGRAVVRAVVLAARSRRARA